MCKDELVLLPLSWVGFLKKEATFEIPFTAIKSVDVAEDGFNNILTITTDFDTIRLTVHQKELSDLRTSGRYADAGVFMTHNWHKKNVDATLEGLKKLK